MIRLGAHVPELSYAARPDLSSERTTSAFAGSAQLRGAVPNLAPDGGKEERKLNFMSFALTRGVRHKLLIFNFLAAPSV